MIDVNYIVVAVVSFTLGAMGMWAIIGSPAKEPPHSEDEQPQEPSKQRTMHGDL